ncbi:MAG: DUF1214 domain-containing protein [Pontixanthobacter sp.]
MPFRIVTAILLAVIVGVGSALVMSDLVRLSDPIMHGPIEVDGWNADFAIGSEAADPYTRARIARHGLLALARSEAVYFTRATDDKGQSLRENCIYRLSGNEMPARWWSVTLYDSQSRLPMNDDDALSVDLSDPVVGDEWTATISAQRPDSGGPWISSRNAGTFDLTLRLYVPDAALIERPNDVLRPPTVERVACAAGVS